MVQAFEKVYDSHWYIMGKELKSFEEEYANFNEVAYAIGVSNGLDALFLSLKALGIGKGDEVIVPSNTFIASLLAVSSVGATPVLVEPDAFSYNLSPKNINERISKNTKAIMPVHLYGQACEMDEIKQIADSNKLFIVEDNAQAHGATFKGKMTGSWGDLNATSFYPGKNLGAIGDGGAVTTNKLELAEEIRMLRNYGSKIKYNNEVRGHNMRLDELQAALLSVKLGHLSNWTYERNIIAKLYGEMLKDVAEITLPFVHTDATHSYHLYVIRTKKRDELKNMLYQMGIETLIHYPIPPHMQKAYAYLGHKSGDFPLAEKLSKTSLSLPIWPGMSPSQVEFISHQIKSFFKRN
ncbi:DegT/DnrJ/EryC1/StrS family aminotransferase [uncultured Algoriphagus sp.]|uniref:DegT/DnrJ/EryC1/StrS family aminotransferase n=1 Tax=uncultured Algoriphagus sp. TaxID=417365 RepID=UPI0030EC11D4